MTEAERNSLDVVRDVDSMTSQPNTQHVWVWIPATDTVQGERFKQALQSALYRDELGTTRGGGNVAVAGTTQPAYVFVVDTVDSQKAISEIVSELRRVNVPKRTFLHIYVPEDKTIRVR